MSNEYHDLQFPEGTYTVNGNDLDVAQHGLQIRTERSTKNVGSVVGAYHQNDTFTVLQVFPEEQGIVWSRVSSNISGTIRYTALRVNNHIKVTLIAAFPGTAQTPAPDTQLDRIEQKLDKLLLLLS